MSKIDSAHPLPDARPSFLVIKRCVGVCEDCVEDLSVKMIGTVLSTDLGGS